MPMDDFLDDASAWFDDLTKPKPRPIVQMTPPDASGTSGYAPVRRNPQTGRSQVQVPDPDHPGLIIWVDALWNPVKDGMEPIDPKYRYKDPDYYNVHSIIQGQRPISFFADSTSSFDFSGPLDLSTPGNSIASAGSVPGVQPPSLQTPSFQSNNGAVWLAVAAIVVVYLWSQ
jgi:hypothetical protein